jgi:hypothetical protein
MPYLILTGGKKLGVSQKKADDILGWKENKNIPKDKLVDTGTGDFIALSMIKGIAKDAEEYNEEVDEKKRAERYAYIKEWEVDRERFSKQSAEEKAKRMIKTGCFALYKARGNKSNKIEGELFDELMMILIPYFENNPKEWWVDRKIYGEIIEYGDIIKSNVKGFKTIGQMIASTV